MADIDKVKVLVVGDSGVGKTSLVHLICHDELCRAPSATIGCSVEVKLHEYRAGTPAERDFFVELWDIGGAASHANSRSIFYHQVHGIILVHDLTNRKSHQNLRKWLAETLCKDDIKPNSSYSFDPEQFVGNQIPILVIGTKADLAESLRERNALRPSSIADECSADEFNLDNLQVKSLAPGSTNAVKLSKFFDKVVERKVASFQTHHSAPQARRHRKNSHND
ncbi:rab-like protein 3 [Elysia marginata]|uniref:Rab-like protein 3 n=1 Tax=Elysia marginata TaxID=1093978 RepID=A0AAV4ELU5_9GAST|nr:rab-like protein 3 [Elysia marginata]